MHADVRTSVFSSSCLFLDHIRGAADVAIALYRGPLWIFAPINAMREVKTSPG